MTATDSPNSGRIRSLQEARGALDVPATEEAVAIAGAPRNRVVAFPVVDEASPEIAAEFAGEIVLRPNGRELRKSDDPDRLRAAAARNLWWLAYGPIVESSDGALVIEQLSLGPALAT